jgi:hypothetical protein
MKDIINLTRFKVFNVINDDIKYCIKSSIYCDYNQFDKDKLHPHAGNNRGVFNEENLGYIKINNKNWDSKPGILFTKLYEYQALFNHYKGIENWKKSYFAIRYANYIKIKNISDRGFKNYKAFLIGREKQIDNLFNSIIKNGVFPTNIKKNKKLFLENISVVLTKDKELYFNNRGHHRLSIAKILNIKTVPVKITLSKSLKNLHEFYLKNKSTNFF